MQERDIVCKNGKHRSDEEKKKLIRRIKIIIGQMNGMVKLIEDDESCDTILMYALSTSNAIKSLGNEVLRDHLTTILSENVSSSNQDALDETVELLLKLNK